VEAGRPADGRVGDVAALFADVARIGPFFAVATGPPPGGGFASVAALAGPPPGPLEARISGVAAALHTDRRVAASTAFQGLAAQLVAPLFAAAAAGVLPVPDPAGDLPATLHWRAGGPGPWLWWRGAGRVAACPDAGEAAEALGAALDRLLRPLVAAVRARVPVSERVLWGDVAAAVAGARRQVAAARPGEAGRAGDLARRLLAVAPLAPTAELLPPEPPDHGWTFRRRTCCLYYRVPGGGLCGDCVLRRPRGR
jgi:hypothetical protein